MILEKEKWYMVEHSSGIIEIRYTADTRFHTTSMGWVEIVAPTVTKVGNK